MAKRNEKLELEENHLDELFRSIMGFQIAATEDRVDTGESGELDETYVLR